MRWMLPTLAVCLISSSAAEAAARVKFCFLFCAVETEPVAIDGFCQSYERVIREPGDAASLRLARVSIQKRTARNDALYRCACQGWTNPICK
jgi:hypothetical protein